VCMALSSFRTSNLGSSSGATLSIPSSSSFWNDRSDSMVSFSCSVPRASFMDLYRYLNDLHCVVAEDINYFDRDFPFSGREFSRRACQFEGTILLGAERLPLVLKYIAAGPHFLKRAGFLVLYPDDFFLALEVEVDGPVVDPVRPLFGEN